MLVKGSDHQTSRWPSLEKPNGQKSLTHTAGGFQIKNVTVVVCVAGEAFIANRLVFVSAAPKAYRAAIDGERYPGDAVLARMHESNGRATAPAPAIFPFPPPVSIVPSALDET